MGLSWKGAFAVGALLTCSQLQTVSALPQSNQPQDLERTDTDPNLLFIAPNGQVRAHFYKKVLVTTVVDGVLKTITVKSQIPFPDESGPALKGDNPTIEKAKTTKRRNNKGAQPKKNKPAVKTTSSSKRKVVKKSQSTTTTTATTTTTTKKPKPKPYPTTTTTTTSTTKKPKPKTSTTTTTTTTTTKSKKPQPSGPATYSSLPTIRTTQTLTSTITVSPSRPSSPITSLTSLSPSVNQTASPTFVATYGSIHSSLQTSGNPSSQPFPTSLSGNTSSLSLINTASTPLPSTSMAPARPAINAPNVFAPMAVPAPPSQIAQRNDHPVPRLGIKSQGPKLPTNKFYANFFLGTQAQPTWTHPYSVQWARGQGVAKSWGMSISHIERGQLAYGNGTPAAYFINPVGIQSLLLSAQELTSNATALTTDSLTAFSVNVNLQANSNSSALISFPLVQGMGFVTARYNRATPLIQSSVSILSLLYNGTLPNTNTFKYKAYLGDQTMWLIYITPDSSFYPGNTFTLTNGNNVNGTAGFTGIIQIAKLPSSTPGGEGIYDNASGVYATGAQIAGSTSGSSGTYSLTWSKGGNTSRTLLMFALPHHIQTLTNGAKTNIQLTTTTKGTAVGVLADSWTLSEPELPTDIGFAPWDPDEGTITTVSATAKQLVLAAASSELSQDIDAQTNLNSMYFSGKALAKFASIIFATNDIGGNKTLAITGLQRLKTALSQFVNNTQIYPLVYESAWGGVVSTGTYQTGDSGLDFGNTYYNDHHFHYAYFVYTAAVIGYLDPSWLTQKNRDWVNILVRDFGNPSNSDPYFPFSRSYDWFHGHSWAKGLFESGDGKDQESSSEDSLACYAIKMWGRISGDVAMEGRGALMMAIQARSVQNYYLYTSDNTVQPPRFIGNKAAGILFENKIDHTTYFGNNIEYIQGIHMLPLLPFSPLVRTGEFVTEEWDTYFSNGRVDKVAGGWRGILYANLAIIDPKTAWNFFSNTSFDSSLLDGGASLTWYRAWSAALGGSR